MNVVSREMPGDGAAFSAPASMRQLLNSEGTIVRLGVSDPLTARIAQREGFKHVILSGYANGALNVRPEPLLDLSSLAYDVAAIQRSITIPLMIDAGACFGEPIHVWNSVRRLEETGAAGLQIEDQTFPKRAHYHRDYQEHTISQAEMVDKVTVAVESRRNRDFVIVARTDTMKTVGYDEGIRRAHAYLAAGADAIQLWPNTLEETERAPRDIGAPVIYGVSHGNRVGRPTLSVEELSGFGYKVVSLPTIGIIATYRAASAEIAHLARHGEPSIPQEELIRARKELEDTIGLEELYRIEERTTERR